MHCLVGQFGTQFAVHISTCHGRQQIHNEHGMAGSHQDEHWSRAGARQRPSHAKDDATIQVAGNASVFVFDLDLLAGRILQVPAFDHLHNEDACQHGRTNDAVHVKALKTEHFINAEVGYSLAFVQGKPEQHAYQYISRHSHG